MKDAVVMSLEEQLRDPPKYGKNAAWILLRAMAGDDVASGEAVVNIPDTVDGEQADSNAKSSTPVEPQVDTGVTPAESTDTAPGILVNVDRGLLEFVPKRLRPAVQFHLRAKIPKAKRDTWLHSALCMYFRYLGQILKLGSRDRLTQEVVMNENFLDCCIGAAFSHEAAVHKKCSTPSAYHHASARAHVHITHINPDKLRALCKSYGAPVPYQLFVDKRPATAGTRKICGSTLATTPVKCLRVNPLANLSPIVDFPPLKLLPIAEPTVPIPPNYSTSPRRTISEVDLDALFDCSSADEALQHDETPADSSPLCSENEAHDSEEVQNEAVCPDDSITSAPFVEPMECDDDNDAGVKVTGTGSTAAVVDNKQGTAVDVPRTTVEAPNTTILASYVDRVKDDARLAREATRRRALQMRIEEVSDDSSSDGAEWDNDTLSKQEAQSGADSLLGLVQQSVGTQQDAGFVEQSRGEQRDSLLRRREAEMGHAQPTPVSLQRTSTAELDRQSGCHPGISSTVLSQAYGRGFSSIPEEYAPSLHQQSLEAPSAGAVCQQQDVTPWPPLPPDYDDEGANDLYGVAASGSASAFSGVHSVSREDAARAQEEAKNAGSRFSKRHRHSDIKEGGSRKSRKSRVSAQGGGLFEGGKFAASIDDGVPPEKRDSLIRRDVRSFVTSCLEPLVMANVISLQQYTESLCRAVDKIMQVHAYAPDASFVQREALQIRALVDKYVRYSMGK